MRAELTYFKRSGKYYASGTYEVLVDPAHTEVGPGKIPPLFQIWEQIAELGKQRRLPGLREGHSEYAVLIDVPDHPHRHPHLIPFPGTEHDPSE